MSDQNRFYSGMLAGMLLMVAASGIHWFIMVSHPNATALQRNGVIGQIVVGAAGAVWLIIRGRPRKSAEPAL